MYVGRDLLTFFANKKSHELSHEICIIFILIIAIKWQDIRSIVSDYNF